MTSYDIMAIVNTINLVTTVQRKTPNIPILLHCRYGLTIHLSIYLSIYLCTYIYICSSNLCQYFIYLFISFCLFLHFTRSNRVGRSAILCAVIATIEQCKTEGFADVFHVVKSMRSHLPGAVCDKVCVCVCVCLFVCLCIYVHN